MWKRKEIQEMLWCERGGQAIDAKTALEYGMVNEVLPQDQLIARAYSLDSPGCTRRRIGSNLIAWKHQSPPAALM